MQRAAVLFCLLGACTKPSADTPAPPEPVHATTHAESTTVDIADEAVLATDDALVEQAFTRLLESAAGKDRCPLLLQKGLGARVDAAKAKLDGMLAKDARFVWSVASSTHGEPVPDGAGGHVNTVEWRVDPAPCLVLVIGESDGVLRIAARLPGPDPLGPSRDWAWMLSTAAK